MMNTSKTDDDSSEGNDKYKGAEHINKNAVGTGDGEHEDIVNNRKRS